MNRWVDGWIVELIIKDEWMAGGWVGGCMNEWIDEWVGVWIDDS